MANTYELVVDTGAIEVPVKDKTGRELGKFYFNPLDSNILSRYDKVVDFFNNIKLSEDASEDERIAEYDKLAKDIAEQFDVLFGYDVSEVLFSKCGALTVVENGDFFYEVVLEGFANLMEKVTKVRVEKKLSKVKKAVASKKGK